MKRACLSSMRHDPLMEEIGIRPWLLLGRGVTEFRLQHDEFVAQGGASQDRSA
jgi:hypothetical protein